VELEWSTKSRIVAWVSTNLQAIVAATCFRYFSREEDYKDREVTPLFQLKYYFFHDRNYFPKEYS